MTDQELLDAAASFLDSLELCFVTDAEFTQQLDFSVVARALTARPVESANQANIHSMREACVRFRRALTACQAARIMGGAWIDAPMHTT
jgi:hypothetical protein